MVQAHVGKASVITPLPSSPAQSRREYEMGLILRLALSLSIMGMLSQSSMAGGCEGKTVEDPSGTITLQCMNPVLQVAKPLLGRLVSL